MLGTDSTTTFVPNNASQRREEVSISDDIEILKLLIALISLITAIVGLAKARMERPRRKNAIVDRR
ncbi:hypothetical protein [uncultured Slackia sp.]|uniref:hypothetical protein n=1 Tax=uncultured Slackia sp. TaxID=665903 RepID=UPI002677320B|nr:hypothetical protein [uncultured Slackia sp.]